MKRAKYYVMAAALGLSAFVGLPTYAEPDVDATNEDDVVLVSDLDQTLELSVTTALTTVTATPSEVSVAVGEEKFIAVTYNDGFDINDISHGGLEFKSGDDEYTAFTGFDGEYDDSLHEYVADYTLVYVYGNYVGSAIYTINVIDSDGNMASTDIAVTVRDALGYDYDSIDGPCDDDPDDECVIYESGATFGTPIEGGREYSMELVPMTDVLRALDNNLNSVFDLTVRDANGDPIAVADNDIEVWFGIAMSQLGDLADSEQLYFQVVYIENGAIVKYFDTEEIENDGWGWMFTVKGLSHFSQYGILVSDTPFESAEDRNNAILPPNTGAFTSDANGVTANYSALIATVVTMSVILSVYKVVEYLRKK